MKSSKQLTKRGFSPILNKVDRKSIKNNSISDRKKKTSSNYHPQLQVNNKSR